jgi:hypothetical protein
VQTNTDGEHVHREHNASQTFTATRTPNLVTSEICLEIAYRPTERAVIGSPLDSSGPIRWIACSRKANAFNHPVLLPHRPPLDLLLSILPFPTAYEAIFYNILPSSQRFLEKKRRCPVISTAAPQSLYLCGLAGFQIRFPERRRSREILKRHI